MAGVLKQQYTEKEQQLKLMNQKYLDQEAAELNNIKEAFKLEYEKLDKMKDALTDEQHNDA